MKAISAVALALAASCSTSTAAASSSPSLLRGSASSPAAAVGREMQSTEDQACYTKLEPDGAWLPATCNLAFLASCVANSGCYASASDAVEGRRRGVQRRRQVCGVGQLRQPHVPVDQHVLLGERRETCALPES
jgi:hypothetical protein